MASHQDLQLMMFEVSATHREDGVIELVPVKVWAEDEGKEISVQEAMVMLGYHCPKRVYALLDAKQIRGWKPESAGGNAHWRIYKVSVTDYKRRRSNRPAGNLMPRKKM